MKRKISNTGDTIFNHNFFNIRVVVYRAWITIIVVIFHRPCAADGQRAVGVQFPGQVVFVPVGYDFAFVYAEGITCQRRAAFKVYGQVVAFIKYTTSDDGDTFRNRDAG